MTNITRLIEAVGWMGALFSLAAYTLLSMGRLDGRSRTYQWMNVAAAAGFVINSGWNGALPSAVVNAVWIGIGLLTLWQLRKSTGPTG